jgi:hypothetical protein
MINAGTAVLLALLMHLGGVDVDRATEARLISYRDSVPVAEWSLTSGAAGVYRFTGTGDAGALVVERLRGAGVVYTVLQYEQQTDPSPPSDTPELRRPIAIGTVSLDGVAASLRRSRPGATFSPDREGIAIAWMEPDDTVGADVAERSPALAENPAPRGTETAEATSRNGLTARSPASETTAPGGEGLSVSVQPSRLSASDATTSQVLILSLR